MAITNFCSHYFPLCKDNVLIIAIEANIYVLNQVL